jgi:lysophospholipase L1-like esterase
LVTARRLFWLARKPVTKRGARMSVPFTLRGVAVPAAMAMAGTLTCCLLIAAGAASATEPAIRVVALGDSITKGVRAGVTAEQPFAALVQAALQDEKLDIEVVNLGIGGERTDQALSRLDLDVVPLKPQAVIIMYGTNDSYVEKELAASRLTADAYQENLRKIVGRLREAGIRPVLMTPPRWGHGGQNGLGGSPNVSLTEFVERCRKVADETGTALVDHFAHWSEAEANGQDLAAWTTDQCHPNLEGHRVLAETALPVLRAALKGAE